MMIAARNAFLMSGAKLPYDAEVEYLESTGTQRIDIGIVGDANVRWEVDAQWRRSTGEDQYIGQTYYSPSNLAPRFAIGIISGRWYFALGNKNQNTSASADTSRHIFVLDAVNNCAYVDSISYTVGYTSFVLPQDPARGIALFARTMVDVVTFVNYMAISVYGSKIFRAGVLVRDFIPVRVGVGSSAVGYLYDRANPDGGPLGNGLYGNAGTGAFVIGPDK